MNCWKSGMSIYFWRSGRRSRQVTPLINIPKIMQLSKMIDGMTSLINIPNIPLLQNCQYSYTRVVVKFEVEIEKKNDYSAV